MHRVMILVAGLAAAPFLAPVAAQSAVAGAPFSCADTTARVLGFLVGAYDAQVVFRAGPTAWDSSRATITIVPDLGGCVIREHFRGTRHGAPYEALTVWSAHGGAAAPIQRTFVHSQHGIIGLSAGRVVGDSLVVDDSVFVRQRWVHQRLVLWREGGSANRLRSEGRRSEDGRATWFVTQRTRYVRRSEEAVGPGRSPGTSR